MNDPQFTVTVAVFMLLMMYFVSWLLTPRAVWRDGPEERAQATSRSGDVE